MSVNMQRAALAALLAAAFPTDLNSAWASAQVRGTGAQCVIDNDNSVEANVYLSAGVYYNGDASNSAKFQCSFFVGQGELKPQMHEIDEVEIYVDDNNNDTTTGVASATLGSHSATLEGTWSSCGTDSSGDTEVSNITLSWTGLDVVSSCTDFTDRALLASVTLPDSDTYGDSAFIGYWIWQSS